MHRNSNTRRNPASQGAGSGNDGKSGGSDGKKTGAGTKYTSSFASRHKKTHTPESSPPKLTKKRLDETLSRIELQIKRVTDGINKEAKFYDDQINELKKEIKELEDMKRKRITGLEATKKEWERNLKENDQLQAVQFLFETSSGDDLDKTAQEAIDKGYANSQIEELLEKIESIRL